VPDFKSCVESTEPSSTHRCSRQLLTCNATCDRAGCDDRCADAAAQGKEICERRHNPDKCEANDRQCRMRKNIERNTCFDAVAFVSQQCAKACPGGAGGGARPAGGGGGWDGRTPFSCSRGQHTFENLDVNVRGAALVADGTCRVVLKNCRLSGTDNGIMASGSSSIEVEGGSIDGRVAVSASGGSSLELRGAKLNGGPVAIMASGSASVNAKTAAIKGSILKSGNAQVSQ
jgi:hypothetical protein